ncbi:MAG: HD-GYP domain-containing protein [Thermoleophilia bacterium]
MSAPEPPPYRTYCSILAVSGAAVVLVALLLSGLRVDGTLAVVLVAGLIAAAIGTVAESGRTALSLVHLPVLAAAYVCSPGVAPALGGLLAAGDNRAYGRWVMIGNAGALTLSGGAAVGTFRLAGGHAAHTSVGDARWFLAAALGAIGFFVVNHTLVAGLIATRYGEDPREVWRANLRKVAAADVVGSTIVVASLGLGAAVTGTTQRAVVGLVGVMAVGLLLALLEAIRGRDAETRARRDAEDARERAEAAEQRALRAERVALTRADVAVGQLHDVATGTVLALVALVDLKDRYTARHAASVGRLCRGLAAELGWTPEDQALAHVVGLVHDIGKVGVPDAVLRKAGSPTDDEWAVIRQHPDWGADALANVAFAPALVEGVRSHHERWDGSGYGAGLAGVHIPLLARVVALCDSYDAMTARRPFRAARSHHEAVAELQAERGRQFDPEMTDAFLSMLNAFDPSSWMSPAADFPAEWRTACIGIDMTRLYVPEPPATTSGAAVPV